MPDLKGLSSRFEHSAELIASFVERVGGKVVSCEGAERRAHTRYVVAIPTCVQPLDDEHQPIDKRFTAATRDISAGGIGLVHTQPVKVRFLGVRLAPPGLEELDLLVRVLRCEPLGSYYDIAGEFVTISE